MITVCGQVTEDLRASGCIDDLVRMVVEEIGDATTPVLVPTVEVQVVGDTLGTFISWLEDLIKSILTKKACFS